MIEIIQKLDINEIADLANRTHLYDRFTPKLIYEKCFEDPDYDAELNILYRKNNQIIGFLIGGFRNFEKGKFGWIKLMAVDMIYRRKKIATQLLNQLENKLISKGATDIKVMDISPNYYMPGLDPRYTEGVVFLLQNGFERVGEYFNMEADLTGNIDLNTNILEEKLIKDSIEIKRAELSDFEPTIEFIRPIWKSWEYEVKQTFKNQPISLHIAKYRGKVVAFSAYAANNIGLPWFGPMGTDPNMRGKKLGEILLKRCLADQKNQGHKISIIPWVGPIGFYLNAVNAKITRVFWTFKKLIQKD